MKKKGWEIKKLGEVCVIERGGSPRPISKYITEDENGINWIKIGDTEPDSKYISKTKEKIIREGMNKSRFVQKGDFLLSNSMSFGRPYILKIDGCIHDGWLVIRDDNKIFNKDYLYYFLGSPIIYSKFKSLAVGGVVNNLNSKMVRNLDVLIPPLDSQTQIVEELDTLNDIIAKKKEQLAELDTLAQTTFYDMFGDPVNNEKGWKIKKLGDVCIIERGGSPRPISQYITNDAGINWIKIGDAEPNSKYINKTKEKIKPEGVSKSRYVQKGDFLLSNSMSFGRPYILNIDGCIHDGWLVIRDDNNVFDKIFLYYFLESPSSYLIFKSLAVGGVVNNLNSKMVRNFNIFLPPLPLQNQFTERIEAIEKQKELINQSITETQLLFDYTMDKYFN